MALLSHSKPGGWYPSLQVSSQRKWLIFGLAGSHDKFHTWGGLFCLLDFKESEDITSFFEKTNNPSPEWYSSRLFDTHLAAEHFTVLHIAPHLSFESKRLDCTLLLDLVCRWHKIASVLSALWLWFANEPLKGNKKCLLIILMDRCSSKAKNKRQRGDIIFH